jgi:hypothetical protein
LLICIFFIPVELSDNLSKKNKSIWQWGKLCIFSYIFKWQIKALQIFEEKAAEAAHGILAIRSIFAWQHLEGVGI